VAASRIPKAPQSMLQSSEEWGQRNNALMESLLQLINTYAKFELGKGLDVGCQVGDLTEQLSILTGQSWRGIDPEIVEDKTTANGTPLVHGRAEEIPGGDAEFDCVFLANVFEHIDPATRVDALREIRRVLRPGGVVVGQIPNPYFPIESHSRLPFMGWLPDGLKRHYWRLSPAPWGLDFYTVGIRTLTADAKRANLPLIYRQNFNYPLEAIPQRLRPVARLLRAPMALYPWSWQFVLQKGS